MMRNISVSLMIFLLSCSSQESAPIHPEDAADLEAWDLSPHDFHEGLQDASQDEQYGETKDNVSGDDAGAYLYPDPAFIHVIKTSPVISAHQEYLADEAVQYRTTDVLPVLDVRALVVAQGLVFAGTAQGLWRYDPKEDRFLPVSLGGDGDLSPVIDIASDLDSHGRLWVLEQGRLYRVDIAGGEASPIETAPYAFAFLALKGDEVLLAPPSGGLWSLHLDGDNVVFEEVLKETTGAIRDIAVDSHGLVYLATDSGLKMFDGQVLVSRTKEDGSLLDNDVRAVAPTPDGRVIVGTALGISILGPEGPKLLPAGVGALPRDQVVAVAAGVDMVAIGHDIGATVLTKGLPPNGKVDHYVSGRWLPSNSVVAVAVEGQRVWIGTKKGISRIEWRKRTFAEKAAYMEALQDAYFWRMDGFVPSDIQAEDPWHKAFASWPDLPQDHASTSAWDNDNDGLWTQMQIGAWCYAYAVTKDERYYEKARRAMDTIFLEIDIPAVDFEAAGLGRGFITRSLVRDDEGPVFDSKKTQSNWHPVHYKGRDYYWKDDTSSDETTGHFFGFSLFYDLCAKDEAERAEVAEYASALASYIVDHGFRLVDLDGEPTTYGHFEPERLAAAVDGLEPCLEKAMQAEDAGPLIAACIGSWYGEGWLNSIEILGYLLATWHMTGDKRFYDAYETLISVYRYDKIAMPHKDTVTITDPALANHSDHELAMLAYHTLIRYEPNEDRREQWIKGLLFLYEYEKGERNPLWAAFVALLAGPEYADIEAAIRSMQEIPFDRRDFLVDNTHRKDALDWPDERQQKPQFDRVFPYDEIGTVWWNSNLRKKVDGSDPHNIMGPMAWLLPYWAMRYAGLIGD